MNLGLNNIQKSSILQDVEKAEKKNIDDFASITESSFANQLQGMIQVSVGSFDLEAANLVNTIQSKMQEAPRKDNPVFEGRTDNYNKKVDDNRPAVNNSNNDIKNTDKQITKNEKTNDNFTDDVINEKNISKEKISIKTKSNIPQSNSNATQNEELKPITNESLITKGKIIDLNNKSEILNSQVEILRSFSDADIKLDMAINPEVQLRNKATKDILAQNKNFLNNITNNEPESILLNKPTYKEANDKEYIAPDKLEGDLKEKLNGFSKSNKEFFDSILSELHKNKITKSEGPLKDNLPTNTEEKLTNGEQVKLENGSGKEGNLGDLNSKNLLKQSINNTNSKSEISKSFIKELNTNFTEGKINSKQVNNIKKSIKNSDIEKQTLVFNRAQLKDLSKITLKMANKLDVNGQMRAQLKLNPQNLGKVTIELNLRANQAELSFKAENEFVAKNIEKQIGALKDKLNDNGIITSKIDVNVDQNKQEQNNNELFSRNKHSKQENNKDREQFIQSFSRLRSNDSSEFRNIEKETTNV